MVARRIRIGATEDALTTAWAAAVVGAGGTVSSGRRTTVDALLSGLRTDGLIGKLDRLFIFAAENTHSALRDMIGATLATATGGPSFTVDRGYTPGSSGTVYINTNYNPSTAGGFYTQNSAHLSVWMGTYPDGGSAVGTITPTNRQHILPDYGNGGTGYYRTNTSGGVSGAVSGGTGFSLANRSTSGNAEGYRNGVQIVSAADASVAIDNSNFGFPDVGGGTADGGQIAGGTFGSSLTSGQVTSLYNRLRTYMTAVGVA